MTEEDKTIELIHEIQANKASEVKEQFDMESEALSLIGIGNNSHCAVISNPYNIYKYFLY